MKQLAMVLVGLCVACGSKSDSGDKPDKADGSGRRRHRNEPQLMLHNLENKLKVYYAEHGEYPKGAAKPLPATVPCCKQPDRLCAVTKEWASDPVWKAFEFEVDEPNRYQYLYMGDGKKVQAMAIGQDDCDGLEQTYVLNTLEDGTLEVKSIEDLGDRPISYEEVERRHAQVEKVAKEAEANARASRDQVDKLDAEIADLNKQVDATVDAVAAAKSAAERSAASAKLAELRKHTAELAQRMTDAKAHAAKAERAKGIHISKQCLDNPLAKGCN